MLRLVVALFSWFTKCNNQDLQSYNSPNSVILVYSTFLQFRLFFSFLHFSLLTIALSQPPNLLPASTFFGFFVLIRCGSFVTCVTSCGSSAILSSAYKFF